MFQHVKLRDDYKNGTICSLPMGRWTSTMDLGNLWTAQSVNQAEVQLQRLVEVNLLIATPLDGIQIIQDSLKTSKIAFNSNNPYLDLQTLFF